jgi:hypothetical protein
MSTHVENCGNVRRQGKWISVAQARSAGSFLSDGAAAMPAVRACSACAGDYEDPERTEWSPDDPDDEEREEEREEERQAPNEEFPAED